MINDLFQVSLLGIFLKIPSKTCLESIKCNIRKSVHESILSSVEISFLFHGLKKKIKMKILSNTRAYVILYIHRSQSFSAIPYVFIRNISYEMYACLHFCNILFLREMNSFAFDTKNISEDCYQNIKYRNVTKINQCKNI